MNDALKLDFIDKLLSFRKGLTVPGNHDILVSDDAKAAIERRIIVRSERRVFCAEHEVACKVKPQGGRLVAYHTEVSPHHYEIADADTFQYIIDYQKLLSYVAYEILGFTLVEDSIGEDDEFVWGDCDIDGLRLHLVLMPTLKDRSTDHLYGHIGSLKSLISVLVLAHEDLPEDRLGAFRILTSGFGISSSISSMKNTGFHTLLTRQCRFIATVERSLSQLRSHALKQMDFGLDLQKYGDERAIAPALLNASMGKDWVEFEKLCRYVFSRIVPCALKGYGQGDFGRLPDSLGILPDDNGQPSRIVLFDAKALVSDQKDRYSFGKDVVSKNVDYVEAAERLSKKLAFEEMTLLFVAQSFSVENLDNFERNLMDEIGRRDIRKQVRVVFLTLDALIILFFMDSDQSQSVISRSKDPSGRFKRILFSSNELREYVAEKKIPDASGFLQHLKGGSLIDETLLRHIVVTFFAREDQYAPYFEEYRLLARDRFR